MMFSATVLLALGLLPAAILAAPSSSPVTERATGCSTSYPDYARVSQERPVESYLPGFFIRQDAGATNKNDMLIEFTVPDGSYGCQLESYFRADYPIGTLGRQDVYFYSTDRPLSRSPRGIDISWANSPAPVSQVGTTRFDQLDPSGGPTQKVINSFVCQPKMTYRLSIGRDFTDDGLVTFSQSPPNGLRMTYNC
jgi:hypothetical protein